MNNVLQPRHGSQQGLQHLYNNTWNKDEVPNLDEKYYGPSKKYGQYAEIMNDEWTH